MGSASAIMIILREIVTLRIGQTVTNASAIYYPTPSDDMSWQNAKDDFGGFRSNLSKVFHPASATINQQTNGEGHGQPRATATINIAQTPQTSHPPQPTSSSLPVTEPPQTTSEARDLPPLKFNFVRDGAFSDITDNATILSSFDYPQIAKRFRPLLPDTNTTPIGPRRPCPIINKRLLPVLANLIPLTDVEVHQVPQRTIDSREELPRFFNPAPFAGREVLSLPTGTSLPLTDHIQQPVLPTSASPLPSLTVRIQQPVAPIPSNEPGRQSPPVKVVILGDSHVADYNGFDITRRVEQLCSPCAYLCNNSHWSLERTSYRRGGKFRTMKEEIFNTLDNTASGNIVVLVIGSNDIRELARSIGYRKGPYKYWRDLETIVAKCRLSAAVIYIGTPVPSPCFGPDEDFLPAEERNPTWCAYHPCDHEHMSKNALTTFKSRLEELTKNISNIKLMDLHTQLVDDIGMARPHQRNGLLLYLFIE